MASWTPNKLIAPQTASLLFVIIGKIDLLYLLIEPLARFDVDTQNESPITTEC